MIILHHPHLHPSPTHRITCSTKTSEPSQKNGNKREVEIRVCTNRTCRRQDSFQTLETLVGLSPPHVSVKPCGCLGRCGAGPNLVALPDAVFVSHCASPTQAARVMVHFCGEDGDDVVKRSLDALALRKKAEVELDKGNYSEAEALFSQAIEAKPIGGIHVAYKGRSAVRLASGNFAGALEDAKEALRLHPKYAEQWIYWKLLRNHTIWLWSVILLSAILNYSRPEWRSFAKGWLQQQCLDFFGILLRLLRMKKLLYSEIKGLHNVYKHQKMLFEPVHCLVERSNRLSYLAM